MKLRPLVLLTALALAFGLDSATATMNIEGARCDVESNY